MKFAVTKSNTGFQKYLDWLEFFNAEYLIFDWKDKNSLNKFDNCSGLILTGGTDVYPGFYSDYEEPESEDLFTKGRDEYEMDLIEKALSNMRPVLCICRGTQLLNVYFKGNLISDLEKVKGVNHKKISDAEVRLHDVNIAKNSDLYDIVKTESGIVTSTHHQAIDKVGIGLAVNAVSGDGVIEGIEFENKPDKGFLLGIQWHPEKFNSFDNPFSKNILDKFLKETKKT